MMRKVRPVGGMKREKNKEVYLSGRFIEPDMPDELKFQQVQFDPNIRRPANNRVGRISSEAAGRHFNDKSWLWEFRNKFKNIRSILIG